ncbi:MAG: hypothetical protein RQ732_02080 [Methylophaga sp.]|nr:hypothetical protein [Methylophaga sp.]
MKLIYPSLLTGLLLSVSANVVALDTVELVNVIKTGNKKGDEIVSVRRHSKQLALTNSKQGTVDIYSIAEADKPNRTESYSLSLADGEQLTSVALHPTHPYFLTAIQAVSPSAAGRVQIHHVDTGKLLISLPTGVGPDAVVIDPTGQFAVLPNEGESFIFNPDDNSFSSPAGSVTLLRLAQDASDIEAVQIALPDLTGKPGFVAAADNRFVERKIDWNGDGKITEEDVDLDGNGTVSENKMTVGSFRGKKVRVKEEDGELFLFPLFDSKADLLEPEYAVFSKDGQKVWLSLQENNGIIVIDTATAKIIDSFGLGTTTHDADLEDNENVSFSETLTALREPDGIALTASGKYFLTADEGDTDPKASKTKKWPTGGGRTISVFDAVTGNFIADTSNQIDAMAHSKGIYPDSRSDNKGAEPEMLISFQHEGIDYAAVGLERANALALVSLETPDNPTVLDVTVIDAKAEDGEVAPEGIAHYFDSETESHFIYTANEKDGTIAVFKLR